METLLIMSLILSVLLVVDGFAYGLVPYEKRQQSNIGYCPMGGYYLLIKHLLSKL